MRELTWDDFAEATGKAYTIEVGGDRIDMTLDRVEQLPHSPRAAGAFRLEFLGPLRPILPQAIYPFDGGGDAMDIFIVAIAQEPAGIRYEAIFF